MSTDYNSLKIREHLSDDAKQRLNVAPVFFSNERSTKTSLENELFRSQHDGSKERFLRFLESSKRALYRDLKTRPAVPKRDCQLL